MSDASQPPTTPGPAATPVAAIAGWLFVAIGFVAPIATIAVAHAQPGFAGANASRGYVVSLIAVVWLLVRRKSIVVDKRPRVTLLIGAIVLVAGSWSSYRILVNASVNREIIAARPAVNVILKAAAAEAALIASRQIAPGEISEQWRPYATASQSLDLADDSVALRTRLIELMRNARSRELDAAREFHQRIDEMGFSTLLEPENLVNPGSRAAALASLLRYRSVLDAYERKLPDLLGASVHDIESLGLPFEGEEEMIAGIRRRAAAEAPGWQAFLAGERKFVDLAEQLLEFIDARSATIRLAEGELEFEHDADHDAFDSKLNEIASLATD